MKTGQSLIVKILNHLTRMKLIVFSLINLRQSLIPSLEKEYPKIEYEKNNFLQPWMTISLIKSCRKNDDFLKLSKKVDRLWQG